MNSVSLFFPEQWKEYELIDSGGFEKLERFGTYYMWRPEPQAVWDKSLSEKEWQKLSHARFLQDGSHGGTWKQLKHIKDQWHISYQYKGMRLTFRLGMTAFKHVGIFPEQAVNWNFIYDQSQKHPRLKVLNLFAYTGGASLAAKAAGADVTHCDSIKSIINWANANMQLSKLSDIRWLVEDAFKFVQREARRGKTYHGIILDPPAYGHGPKGEKWKLEYMVNDLTKELTKILDKQLNFLVFNSYSLGFSSLVLENLITSHFSSKALHKLESGELYLQERSGRKMPMGIVARFQNMDS